MPRNVLVIEDQDEIARLIKLHLQDLSYGVKMACDGITGFAEAESRDYDLIILDLMLPGMDGLELCRRLRANSNETPILILTSKSTELDRVLGLELGADDYLTKPFSVHELMARVKAILRRARPSATATTDETAKIIRSGELAIDTEKHEVRKGARALELTAKEFDLLVHFARNPGRVYSRSELLDAVWRYSHGGYEHTVNSHINRLRSKIERDPANPEYILTVWSVGYKFAEIPERH